MKFILLASIITSFASSFQPLSTITTLRSIKERREGRVVFHTEKVFGFRSRSAHIPNNLLVNDVNACVYMRDSPRRKIAACTSSSYLLSSKSNDEVDRTEYKIDPAIIFGIIALGYWYFLVFGALAEANGLPIPDFIPLVPGWPPSDQDLIPVIEDSVHFFYISDLLSSGQQQDLPQLRLAFFNFAEAWVFAFLPLLLADRKKLPLPVVIGTWLGALGLTNAFLTPYLAIRQLSILGNGGEYDNHNTKDKNDEQETNNEGLTAMNALKLSFGCIASLVVGYAGYETILTTLQSPDEWKDFLSLVQHDRTYLAFMVDLILFSYIQLFLLEEVSNSKNHDALEKLPFIGLISWLFRSQ